MKTKIGIHNRKEQVLENSVTKELKFKVCKIITSNTKLSQPVQDALLAMQMNVSYLILFFLSLSCILVKVLSCFFF